MVTMEVMLIEGGTSVVIRQGLLSYSTNSNYAEPVATSHQVYSLTSEFITTIKLH